MLTTVISVRGRKRDELLADPSFVYVGRRCAGWPASIWGNPFRVGDLMPDGAGKMTAAQAIAMYQIHIEAQIIERPHVYSLDAIRGKTLGCWCGSWRPGDHGIQCHALILAMLADATEAT